MKPALILYFMLHGLPRWFSSKEMQEMWVPSLGWEDPLEEEMATYSRILAWKRIHGHMSLAGYSPRGLKESDKPERACTQCQQG